MRKFIDRFDSPVQGFFILSAINNVNLRLQYTYQFEKEYKIPKLS